MPAIQALLTRPAPQALQWQAGLAALGVHAEILPLMAIAPCRSAASLHALDVAHRTLEQFSALMFVSASAVRHFWTAPALAAWHALADSPSRPRLWAPGPGTAQALLAAGLPAQAIDQPAEHALQFDSEALWDTVGRQVVPSSRVLIVRGMDGPEPQTAQAGAGRPWLARQIEAQGASARFIAVYRREIPAWGEQDFACAEQARHDGAVWIFSSSQALAHLQKLMPQADWSHSPAVATHPRIAAKARELGFAEILECQPDRQAVAGSLKSWLARRPVS